MTEAPRPTAHPGARSMASGRARHSPQEWRALADLLRHQDRWHEAASALVADLGFRLVEGRGGSDDDSHLLVALRDRPTLRHFDPESVSYYAPVAGGAKLTTLDSTHRGPFGATGDTPLLWGQVLVVDRIPVHNRFLTFGGSVRSSNVDPGLTLLDLWSPVPMVRWGGHSQGTDSLTQAIGAFFARLMVPIDFNPGAEARIDATSPDVLYRAFLVDATRRARQAASRGFAGTDLEAWLTGALRHARADATSLAAAHDLLDYLDL
jgi:hypothetical protein